MRRVALVVLVLLGTVAGMALPVAGQSVDTESANAPPDPDEDVIGWENGVWYNESIAVNQTGTDDAGLTERETELLLARTMARVEHIRGLEFTEPVTVEFVSREEFKERFDPEAFGVRTNDQVYEAMFVYGEAEEPAVHISRFLESAVVGYAAEEGSENLTIIVREDSLQAVDPAVLAHELVHVLQDQHFDLGAERYRRDTLDGTWARAGLIEGEAAYVDHLYSERCDANWSCVATPSDWSGASIGSEWVYSRLGSQPYQDGATFVYELRRQGGWDAVDRAHDSPPTTSEQIIHADPALEPVPLTVEDRSTAEWEPYHTDRLGEIGVFTLFYAHARLVPSDREVLEGDAYERQHPWDTLDSEFGPSSGWGNDRFVAYRNGEKRGYVWTTAWDSNDDAEEFAEAYERALLGFDAREVETDTYRIEEDSQYGDSFADAFLVVRDGRTVTIVNAPTAEELHDLDSRASVGSDSSLDSDSSAEESPSDVATETTATDTSTTESDHEGRAPMTPAVVVVAVVLVAIFVAWRS